MEDPLAELRESFRPRVAARVTEIAEEWETARLAVIAAATVGPAQPDLLRRLHRLAHSLAGAAGTFGFPTVGDAARALERRLERAGTALAAADADEIALLVAALNQVAATALS